MATPEDLSAANGDGIRFATVATPYEQPAANGDGGAAPPPPPK